jgi:hypothetical protein
VPPPRAGAAAIVGGKRRRSGWTPDVIASHLHERAHCTKVCALPRMLQWGKRVNARDRALGQGRIHIVYQYV